MELDVGVNVAVAEGVIVTVGVFVGVWVFVGVGERVGVKAEQMMEKSRPVYISSVSTTTTARVFGPLVFKQVEGIGKLPVYGFEKSLSLTGREHAFTNIVTTLSSAEASIS